MTNTVRIYETDNNDLIYAAYLMDGENRVTVRKSIIEQYEEYYEDDTIVVEGLTSIRNINQLDIGPVYNYNIVFNAYELSRMQHLYTLVLSGVEIIGGFNPTVLKSLQLNTVDLERIQIRGSLQSFSGCTIQCLNVSRCEFSDSTVTGPIDMKCNNLVLHCNGLSMQTIPVVKSLRTLKVIGENIVEIGPVDSMAALEILHVEQCGLSGHIPSSICTLSRLRILTLSKNQMKGQIPSDIKRLSRLQSLNLSHNQLEGTVPDLPPYLEKISLHYNRLSGSIHTVLVPNIELVHIYGNPDIYGTISSDRFVLHISTDFNGRVSPENRDDWFSSICTDSRGTEYISYIFLGMYGQ